MENRHILFESKVDAHKQVPLNSIRKIKIEERIYGLAHTDRGFVAFNRSCPHAGADLTTGKINYLGDIVCPLHAYTFNLLDGREESSRCPEIKLYKTIWEGEKLFMLIKESSPLRGGSNKT